MISKAKKLSISGGVAIAVLLSATVGLKVFAQQQSTKQIAALNTHLADLQDIAANETVARLDEKLIAMQIGPSALIDNPNDDIDNSIYAVNEVLSEALNDYFNETLLLTESAPLPAVPEEVVAYIQAQETHLADIKTLLTEMPAPVWAFDSAAGYDTVLPQHWNTIKLHQMLTARSILHIQAGQTNEAQDYLQAAQNLQTGLGSSPLLLYQLYSYIMLRPQLVVQRFGTAVSTEIAPESYAQTMLESVIRDNRQVGRSMLQQLNHDSNSDAIKAAIIHPFPKFFPKAMMQLSLSDRAAVLEENFQAIAQQNICDRSQTPTIEYAAWNPFKAKYDISYSPLATAADVSLSAELNTLVDEAQTYFKVHQQWPQSLNSSESVVCPGTQWIYEKTAEGITLSYSGEAPSSRTSSPLTYRASTAIQQAP